MYILRDYQKEAVDKGIEFFEDKKQKKPSILVAPTGAGKSLIIANIAKALKDPVLVLQPSKELLEQNYNKFISYGGEASIFSASFNKKEISHVTFATIGSIASKPELFEDFKYVISDECHLNPPAKKSETSKGSMFNQFFEDLDVKILGLTATPFRLKSYGYPDRHSKLNMLMRERPKIFKDIIHVTQIKDLYSKGYLCPIKYVQDVSDQSLLKVNTTGADYTEESKNKFEEEQEICKKIAIGCEKTSKRHHVLIFVPTTIQGEKVQRFLPGCEFVHSKLKKKERQAIIERFRSGQTRCVVNVGVLQVGFDYPEIDMIVDASPTLSLARYYQRLGRGIRPHDSKENCLVVDLVGNYQRFGKIENLEVLNHSVKKWGVYSHGELLTGVPMWT